MTIIRICRFFLNYLPKFNHCLTWSAVQNARSSLTCREEICVGLHVVGLFARPTFLSTLLHSSSICRLSKTYQPSLWSSQSDSLEERGHLQSTSTKMRPTLRESSLHLSPMTPLYPIADVLYRRPCTAGCSPLTQQSGGRGFIIKACHDYYYNGLCLNSVQVLWFLMGEHFSLSNEDTPYQ